MSVSFEMLLHPELLTNAQLLCVFQERHLRIPNVELMQRDELLHIYHHYCLPYGQRKYRDSGRGKVLNKTRQPSPERTKKVNIIANQESIQNKANPHCDRLKPPPECTTNYTKRIKIETTISPIKTTDYLNFSKRKIAIDSMTLASDCPPTKKERKPITWP